VPFYYVELAVISLLKNVGVKALSMVDLLVNQVLSSLFLYGSIALRNTILA
jgi:hypothetical protein